MAIPAAAEAGAVSPPASPPQGCMVKGCHAAYSERKHPHPPAASGECESCHEATGAKHPGGGGAFRLAAEGAELCRTCHEAPAGKNSVHAPVAEGQCTTCHDPHGSSEERLLKQGLNGLCYQCHEAARFEIHVIRGVRLGTGHPLSGVPDPSRPGQSVSCVSCHDPHASDSPTLWRFGVRSAFELCGKCHRYE